MPPAGSTDDDLSALERAVRQGQVRVVIDPVRLTHIDSPVVMEADANLWVYAGIAASLAGFAGLGPWAGSGIAIAALGLYLSVGKRYVRRRLESRVRDGALRDEQVWRRLWRFGGVTLESRAGTCVAPAGNWRHVVRDLAQG